MKFNNPTLEAWASVAFDSQAQMIKAISDPQYRRDEAYRAAVARKMDLSSNEQMGTNCTVHTGELTETVDTSAIAQAEQAAETEAAGEALAALAGPMTLRNTAAPSVNTDTEGVTRVTLAVPGGFESA